MAHRDLQVINIAISKIFNKIPKLTWSEVIVGCAVSSRVPFRGLPEKRPPNEYLCADSGSDELVAAKVFWALGLRRLVVSLVLASRPVTLCSIGDVPNVSGIDALLDATVS